MTHNAQWVGWSYVYVRCVSLTSDPCRLSLWGSPVASWPLLSPALWQRGGRPAAVAAAAVWPATGRRPSQPAKRHDQRERRQPGVWCVTAIGCLQDTLSLSVQVTHSQLMAHDPATSEGTDKWKYSQEPIWFSKRLFEKQSGQISSSDPPYPSSDAFLKIVGRFMSVKAAEDYLILSVSPKHGYDVWFILTEQLHTPQ